MEYKDAGVDIEAVGKCISEFSPLLRLTFNFPNEKIAKVTHDIGYFANIIKLKDDLSVALTMDGVGTKTLIAQKLNKYDTIGIDAVAMNANDLLCVGAEPIALLDYIALSKMDQDVVKRIVESLYEGAKLAKMSIVGGEIAQLPDMIQGIEVVAAAIGVIKDKTFLEREIEEGDVLVGLRSNGLHANGFSLVRKIIFEKKNIDINQYIPEFGKTLGEELLKPTRIYTNEILKLLDTTEEVKALFHISGGGFLNLSRVRGDIGFVIKTLPEPHPIFRLLQDWGEIPTEEMYKTFNMGIGFCVVLSREKLNVLFKICIEHNLRAYKLGYTIKDSTKTVYLKPKGLKSIGNAFYPI